MKKKTSHRAYSFFGSIALINFPHDFSDAEKVRVARRILRENKTVKTVLEKLGKFKGRLRKIETRHLAGEKNKEVLYRENGCVFRFNIDSTYFSPRLSNERKEISELIKSGEKVLVMFAGVAPFSIVIAKNSKARVVYSNEINREANKYAKMNIELNKLKDKVKLVSGDAKRISRKFFLEGEMFDVIVMPRPQLKDSFLEDAFRLVKKGTRIYYYDFCQISDMEKIVEKVKEEAKLAKVKIKILNVKRAGDIAPYKIRLRIDFIVK